MDQPQSRIALINQNIKKESTEIKIKVESAQEKTWVRMKALEKKRAEQRRISIMEHRKRDLLPLAELKAIEKDFNQAKMKNEYLRH